jgi:hypothetical protein
VSVSHPSVVPPVNLAKSGTLKPLGYGIVSKYSGYAFLYALAHPFGANPSSSNVRVICSLMPSDISLLATQSVLKMNDTLPITDGRASGHSPYGFPPTPGGNVGPYSAVWKDAFDLFIKFTNDYSRYGYIYRINHRSESLDKYKIFKPKVENQHISKIKIM